jgi:hypothetical protein
MAYLTSTAHGGQTGIDLRENALAILFLLLIVAAIALRLLITPQVLNMAVNYTLEGGAFYQKLHIATYFMFALLFAVIVNRLRQPLAPANEDSAFLRSMLRYAAVMGTLVIYFAISGRLSTIGFLVDTYLVAVLMVIVLLLQSEQVRRTAAVAVLYILIASAFAAIAEVILQRHLLPVNGGGEVFRAYGLSSHPLALGGQCVLALSFVPLMRWPRWVKVLIILALLLGCVAANARTALAASLLAIFLLIFLLRWRGLSPRDEFVAKFITLSLVLVLGAALTILLLSLGLLSRFHSVVDDSSLARLQVYEVFQYVSWKDILIGMDAADLLQIVNEKVGIQHIESALVYFVMLMGLPMAILFILIIVSYVRCLLTGTATAAKIGVVLILLVDLTNNAFATKSVDVLLISILLVGLGRVPARPQRERAANGRIIPKAGPLLPIVRHG